MTIEDVKEVTEVAKEKLKENGDIYSEHILAYISYLEKQNEKMKCCYNCKYGRIYFTNEIIVDCLANKVNSNNKFNNCDKWELAE